MAALWPLRSLMRDLIKRVAHGLLGDYGIYRVWRLDARQHQPSSAGLVLRPLRPEDMGMPGVAAELAESRWYLGDQAYGFGCFEGEQLLGLAFYWQGGRYAARHSWPIEPQAAKLVQIVTAPAARGWGVATLLIQASAAQMQAQGWAPLYARIWHFNTPSQRAFSRAGWRPCGWLVQINPLRRARPWNLCVRRR